MNFQSIFILFILLITGNACLSRFTNRLREKIDTERYLEESYVGPSSVSDPDLKKLFLNISQVALEQNQNSDWQFRIRFQSIPERSLCIFILKKEIEERELNTNKEYYIRYYESGGKYPNITILDWEKRKDVNNILKIGNHSLHECNDESFKEKFLLEMFPIKEGFFPNTITEVILPSYVSNRFHFLGRNIPMYSPTKRKEDAVDTVFSFEWHEELKLYTLNAIDEKYIFPNAEDKNAGKINTLFLERTKGKKDKIHFYLALEDEIKTYFFYAKQSKDSLYKTKIIPPFVVLEDFSRKISPAPPPKRKLAKFLNLFLPFSILADVVTYPFQLVDCLSEYNWTKAARKECQ